MANCRDVDPRSSHLDAIKGAMFNSSGNGMNVEIFFDFLECSKR